jgi:hypothetical protein
VDISRVPSPGNWSFAQVIHSVGNLQLEVVLVRKACRLFDAACELSDLVVNGPPLFHELAYFLVRVHDCGVVSVAE